MPQADPEGRIGGFARSTGGYSGAEQAVAEAPALSWPVGWLQRVHAVRQGMHSGAVLHEQQPEEIEIDAGSVILHPRLRGVPELAPRRVRHGRLRERVCPAIQFERMLSAAGPTGGHVQRPSDGGEVERIAFNASAWAAAIPPAEMATARPYAA